MCSAAAAGSVSCCWCWMLCLWLRRVSYHSITARAKNLRQISTRPSYKLRRPDVLEIGCERDASAAIRFGAFGLWTSVLKEWPRIFGRCIVDQLGAWDVDFLATETNAMRLHRL